MCVRAYHWHAYVHTHTGICVSVFMCAALRCALDYKYACTCGALSSQLTAHCSPAFNHVLCTPTVESIKSPGPRCLAKYCSYWSTINLFRCFLFATHKDGVVLRGRGGWASSPQCPTMTMMTPMMTPAVYIPARTVCRVSLCSLSGAQLSALAEGGL